ncbi:diaminopimelate aminotransferase [Synergistales bacterium]|nr:diaminopimelate aminotransferase [Synergistales bacterium]
MDTIFAEIERQSDDMVAALSRICRVPAISPHNGGDGEEAKAKEIEKLISELGLGPVEWQRVDDAKSPTGNRPSLFLEYKGASPRRLCILSHMDIVPEGDRSFWSLDPYNPVVRGSRLYGRGVADNGMAIISSLYALYALKKLNITPAYTICLVFLSDEELGSSFGVQPLLERGLFRDDDLVIAPDSGNDRGYFVEVAEKSMLRMEFTVTGKQAHASRPQTGLNACRVANLFSAELDEALHVAFKDKDELFDPPVSTFEPTRRYANVPNLNTIPGKEHFGFDCRVLPSVPLKDVLTVVERVKDEVSRHSGAVIELETKGDDAAPPTSKDSDIARLLLSSLTKVLNVKPVFGGIGGGTFAAFFRRKGIPAVVWQQEAEGTAHQPDEYTEIEYIINNAKVFAGMMSGN